MSPAMIEGKIALNVSVLGGAWHNDFNPFNGAMTAEQACTMSGADWIVGQKEIPAWNAFLPHPSIPDVFVKNPDVEPFVPGFKMNIREKDSVVLGFVSDVYRPIQNSEAFSFVDHIIGTGEAKIHSAGVLFNKYNRPTRIFITAELKPITLMQDKINNYLVFSHSHDGLNAVKAFVSPVRVVCNNTLTLATDTIEAQMKRGGTAPRYWSCKHTGDVSMKLQAAQQTLKLYDEYIAQFPVVAEGMNAINLYDEEIVQVLDALFPDDGTAGKTRMAHNAQIMRDDILKVYSQKEDIARFRGTAWGLYQAITDVIEHRTPFRNTATAAINREFQIVEGHPITTRAQKILCSIRG